MELVNATKMQAGYSMGMQPDGRELLVVLVKGTFTIPTRGEIPRLKEVQLPLVEADTFTGEPGLSAPIYESDYCPIKRRCDVLLLGSAYSPGGLPVNRVRVSLQVASKRKEFDVVGDRFWADDLFGTRATLPEFFTTMPFSYDVAFGGLDNLDPNPKNHAALPANPIGRGYFPQSHERLFVGRPLPNTEEPGRSVDNPRRAYQPMGFGPIGRNWQPRPSYAGTYDQHWIDNIFPFLPPDFDEQYYQCAPPDQQLDQVCGGEQVSLTNLTPEGKTEFHLPEIDVPVTFYYKGGTEKQLSAIIDTLVIEPDANRFTMLWRACMPLRKNMFEVVEVVAGRMPRAWYRARELGKTYYPSLSALVDSRGSEPSATEVEEAQT